MSRTYFTLAVAATLVAVSTPLVAASDISSSDMELESASDARRSSNGASTKDVSTNNDGSTLMSISDEEMSDESTSTAMALADTSRSQTRTASSLSRYALYRGTGWYTHGTHDEAQAICASHGGWLATITSRADQEQLITEIGHLDWSPYGACTAGGDSKREGYFSWIFGPAGVIGRPISLKNRCVQAYCRWAKGEPNNRNGRRGEDILAIRPARYGFRWNDQRTCNDIICEFAPETPVPETPVPESTSVAPAPTTAPASGSETHVTEMESTAKVLSMDAATNDHNSAAKSQTTPAPMAVPPVPPSTPTVVAPKATSFAETPATPAAGVESALQSDSESSPSPSPSSASSSVVSEDAVKDVSAAVPPSSASASEPMVLGREAGSAGAVTDSSCIWYDWSTWSIWCWIVFVICMIALYCILHGLGYLVARRYLGNRRQFDSTCGSSSSSSAEDAVDAFTSIEVKATQQEEENEAALDIKTGADLSLCEEDEESDDDHNKSVAVILMENPLGAEFSHLYRSPQEEEGLSEQTCTDEAITITNGSFSTASAPFEIVAGVCQQEETVEMCDESAE